MTRTHARLRFPAAVFAGVVLVLVSAPFALARSMQAQSVEIAATEPWTDSGITVEAGESVTVVADGEVSFGSGPLGSMPPSGVPWGAACDEIRPQTGTWTAEGLPCWSLIARVGEGEPIAVGDRATFEALADGPLQLGVNDDAFADNSGSWTASVTVSPAGAAPDPAAPETGGSGDSSSVLPLVLGAVGALALIVLIVVALRRRTRSEDVDETPAPSRAVAAAVADESVDVNIFEAQIVDGAALRVGYNYFPADTLVRWRIMQNGSETAAGEFVTEGGGSTYHFVTLPFEKTLAPDAAGTEVRFAWTIGDVPFEYSVLEQRTG